MHICGDPSVPDISKIYQKEDLSVGISDQNTSFGHLRQGDNVLVTQNTIIILQETMAYLRGDTSANKTV